MWVRISGAVLAASVLAGACRPEPEPDGPEPSLTAGRSGQSGSASTAGAGGQAAGGTTPLAGAAPSDGGEAGADGGRHGGGSRAVPACGEIDLLPNAYEEPSDTVPGVSTRCGDGLLDDEEECDDGDGDGTDACSADCRTRDQRVTLPGAHGATAKSRRLGDGRHPIDGRRLGFMSTYVEQGRHGRPKVVGSIFNYWGQPTRRVTLSREAAPHDEPNPVVAALPRGGYAVAWTDERADRHGLGVALRYVGADGAMCSLGAANEHAAGAQQNPDVLWAAPELVAAWEHETDAGKELRYRTFDATLQPTSGDVVLGDGPLPKHGVALARLDRDYGWMAAYRETLAAGRENIVLDRSGETYRIGPIAAGPPEDRPALLDLDGQVLVVFTESTDPNTPGLYDTPRLRYAVVDPIAHSVSAIEPLEPLRDEYILEPRIGQRRPAIVRHGGKDFFIAWQSDARPGDPYGSELWLKPMGFNWRDNGPTPFLNIRHEELPLPRTCAGRVGEQRVPALGSVEPWMQGLGYGALAMAWEVDAEACGGDGASDVMIQYTPVPELKTCAVQVLEEQWKSALDGELPASWRSAPSTAAVSIANQGAKIEDAQGGARALVWPYDFEPLNVDIEAEVTWNQSSAVPALFARRWDSEPNTYAVASFGADEWRIEWMNDGTPVTLVAAAPAGSMLSGETYRARFTVESESDPEVYPDVFLAAKLWRATDREPGEWAMQITLPALSPPGHHLGQVSGRVGFASWGSAPGSVLTFDAVKVRHYGNGWICPVDREAEEAPPFFRTPTPDVCAPP